MIEVQFTKLSENAKAPTKSEKGAGIFNLYASEETWIDTYYRKIVKTGIGIEIPAGWCALLLSPHGRFVNVETTVFPAPILLESGFSGEIMVPLKNHWQKKVKIAKHEKIAKMMFIESKTVNLREVGDVKTTEEEEDRLGSLWEQK